MKILAINGSYRDRGITDQCVEVMTQVLEEAGVQVETVNLRSFPIGFCENCRACTQSPGEEPGTCVLHDDMAALVDKIEAADGYILASPTNFGTVTALFKRFMERLTVYAYWPWGTPAPKYRKERRRSKKAVLIFCARPPVSWGAGCFIPRRLCR